MSRRTFFKQLSVLAFASVLKGREAEPEVRVGPVREGQPRSDTYSQSYYEPPRDFGDSQPFYRVIKLS